MEGSCVFEIMGERLHSTWYHVGDGYFYTVSKSDNNRVFLKCKVPKCRGRASMPLKEDERRLDTFKTTMTHNHDPDFHQLPLLDLRRRIFERCSNESTSFLTIWKEETARIDVQTMTELAAGRISFNSLHSSMHRARAAKQPKRPPALDQEERSRSVEAARKGQEAVVVATDVASTGSDSASGQPVINYDIPDGDENFGIMFVSDLMEEVVVPSNSCHRKRKRPVARSPSPSVERNNKESDTEESLKVKRLQQLVENEAELHRCNVEKAKSAMKEQELKTKEQELKTKEQELKTKEQELKVKEQELKVKILEVQLQKELDNK